VEGSFGVPHDDHASGAPGLSKGQQMNKTIHGLIAAGFGIACWFLWLWLTMCARFLQDALGGNHIPGFTILVLNFRPVLVILPTFALAYCLYTWFRSNTNRGTWQGFFASAMAVLTLLMLPCMFAVWLPVLSMIEMFGLR
jgi:hypothetical protein